MRINWNPITKQDALGLLQEWSLTNQTVMLSIHFASGARQHVVTYHTGQLQIEDVSRVNLISPYDQHVSVDAASYQDFLTGETDGKRWVIMKPGVPSVEPASAAPRAPEPLPDISQFSDAEIQAELKRRHDEREYLIQAQAPIVMFRLKTEGDDFLDLPPNNWTVN